MASLHVDDVEAVSALLPLLISTQLIDDFECQLFHEFGSNEKTGRFMRVFCTYSCDQQTAISRAPFNHSFSLALPRTNTGDHRGPGATRTYHLQTLQSAQVPTVADWWVCRSLGQARFDWQGPHHLFLRGGLDMTPDIPKVHQFVKVQVHQPFSTSLGHHNPHDPFPPQ